MGNMFLTPEDLYELTDLKRSAEQLCWLRERGYAHDIGVSGKPKVLRAEVERHLIGGKGKANSRGPRSPSLDLRAITEGSAA